MEKIQIDRNTFKFIFPYNSLEALYLLQTSNDFIEQVISSIKSCKFKAVFWECKPFTYDSKDNFEFVVINAPELEKIQANFGYFSEHFKDRQSIKAFPSLNKDSILISMYPIADLEYYSHLSNVLNNAPIEQVYQLFRTIGKIGTTLSSDGPVWLSTSGLGVSYIHVRFDTRPKYYRFGPYKKF
jgi:hypothetical protein